MATEFKGFIVPTPVLPVVESAVKERMKNACKMRVRCASEVKESCEHCLFDYDPLTPERIAAFEEWEKTQ